MQKYKKYLIPVLVIALIAVVVILIQKNIIPGFGIDTAEVTQSAPETSKTVDTKAQSGEQKTEAAQTQEARIKEDGIYDSKEDVALYIHTYGKLPSNYIKKADAEALGWPGGELEPYAPGKCIGGDSFSNREGLLPKASGRKYTECDIDTLGAKSRGAKRIVFSNDGLIFYTEDHYESFTQLY